MIGGHEDGVKVGPQIHHWIAKFITPIIGKVLAQRFRKQINWIARRAVQITAHKCYNMIRNIGPFVGVIDAIEYGQLFAQWSRIDMFEFESFRLVVDAKIVGAQKPVKKIIGR